MSNKQHIQPQDEDELMQELQSLWDIQDEHIRTIAERPEAQPRLIPTTKQIGERRFVWWRYGIAAAIVALAVVGVVMRIRTQRPQTSAPLLAVHQEAKNTKSQSVLINQPQQVSAKSVSSISYAEKKDIEHAQIGETEEEEALPLVAAVVNETVKPTIDSNQFTKKNDNVATPTVIVVETNSLVTFDKGKGRQGEERKKDIFGNPVREDTPLLAWSL